MKITIEFENPCELVDLLRKLSAELNDNEPTVDADYLKSCQEGYESLRKTIADNDSGIMKVNKPPRYPTMYTEQDETPISHDHTKIIP